MSKILIAYCSPADQDRLRIDREHRAVDEALKENNSKGNLVVRSHATTIRDLVEILNSDKFSVVQFSGHGSEDEIIFDSEPEGGGRSLSIANFVQIIKASQPSLKLVILLSCYSKEACKILHDVSPYVITVEGEADDGVMVDFVGVFYLYYLRAASVEHAFSVASTFIEDGAEICLSRRVDNFRDNPNIIPVLVRGARYSGLVYVDISEAESDIKRLEIDKSEFLEILSRKIRLHEMIFKIPRENALISIGKYIGYFSWAPDDRVRCHRILELRDDVDLKHIEEWADFLVAYNECALERYRMVVNPADPTNRRYLAKALFSYTFTYDYHFNPKQLESCAGKYAPKIYAVSKSLAKSNLEFAKTKIKDQEYDEAVYYLESALSAMHDVLDAITEAITKERQSE